MPFSSQLKFVFSTSCLGWLLILLALVSFPEVIGSGVFAQDDISASKANTDTQSAADVKKEFDKAIADLRIAIKQVRRSSVVYYESESNMSMTLKQQWDSEAATAKEAFARVRKTAFTYFLMPSKNDPEIMKIVNMLNPRLIEEGQLTLCSAATKKLIELNPGNIALERLMGRIAILTNDFETAAKFAPGHQADIEEFSIPERALFSTVHSSLEKFARERKLRKQETEADDLPHAFIETQKGTIVIELFENQAPETVGNFVSLVEAEFYDGMIFHHVLRNILAHSGSMSMDRALPAGYSIYDECNKPDARHHFRGSVSMYIPSLEENVGGAEFQILMIPAPNLDGRNTVFGRVISGLDVLDSIQDTFIINDEGKEEFVEGVTPDTINKITVKRLRPHEYEPNTVK